MKVINMVRGILSFVWVTSILIGCGKQNSNLSVGINSANEAQAYSNISSTSAIGDGLAASYFADKTLSKNVLNRIDPFVNFNWGSGSPALSVPSNNFSARWEGFIKVPQDGDYTFYVYSNDGNRLSVDGMSITNRWSDGTNENSGTIRLTQGKFYPIKLEMYEGMKTAKAVLSWSFAGQAKQVVSRDVLYSKLVIPTPTPVSVGDGLAASYFDDTTLTHNVFKRIDPFVNFNWGLGAPTALFPSDYFSIRWEGFVEAPVTDDYTFYVLSNDGNRLLVDGQSITNRWFDGVVENSGTIKLTQGQRYSIALEVYEGINSAQAVLSWSFNGQAKQVVPRDVLYSKTVTPVPPAPRTGITATVTSPFLVTNNPYNQDTEYRVTSSLRQANAANPLPFDMPARSVLAASSKKAYTHYFPLFSVSLDNADSNSDYYANGWLKADGEGGKHLAYGGFIRDRPLPRAPRPGDWALADITDETRWARDAGLDGFLVDTLSWNLSDGFYKRGRIPFDGAKNLGDSSFKVAYMVDTDIVSATDSNTAADRIAEAYNSGSYLTVNGKLVVSSFRPEGSTSISFWQNIAARLTSAYGLPGMAFVPCYSSNWNAHPTFDLITYAMGIWSIGETPGANSAVWNNDAKSIGKLFMQPIAFGDSRPRNGIFNENEGMLTLRDQWLTAIANNVDWVQYRTWNDFSEGAQLMPTRNHGFSYLDVSSYYLTRWKTGAYPQIKQDALYLSHRISSWDNRNTQVSQTLWQMPRNPTSNPGKDIVEVMSFLTAPGEVTVNVGPNIYTYSAPAGVFNKQFPLSEGQVSAKVSR